MGVGGVYRNRDAAPMSFVTRSPGASAPGDFVWGLSGSFVGQGFIEYAREAGDHYLLGARAFQRGNAGTAGCAAGQHIIYKQDFCPAKVG